MKKDNYLSILFTILLLLIAGACTPFKQPANSALLTVGKSQYKVKKGDSLYAIAFKYGLDYKQLARVNQIKPPYIIKIGQVLSLQESARFFIDSSDHQNQSFFQVKKMPVYPPENAEKKIVQTIQVDSYKPKSDSDRKNNRKKSVIAEKTTSNSLQNRLEIQNRKNNQPHKVEWLHPVEGRITKTFSMSGRQNKGIDYSAQLGTDVVSSRSGEVVYAGSRLKGYGKLIIIKHDDAYLSAYAHNRTIKVKEGDIIKQGQKIAEVGQTGTQSPRLHFEIRRFGKPVDPLSLLARQ